MTTTTSPPHADVAPPPLGPRATGGWLWRQLTSMRTALVLLLLLALAAIPGSVLPQRSVAPERVLDYERQHPTLAPWLGRLGFFDVYSSVWFSAIYLLLFVSLVGCVVPRSRQLVTTLRRTPPAAPRNLARLPAYRTFETDRTPAEVLHDARTLLSARRFRLARPAVGTDAVASEKGYLHEVGNLGFHLSLLLFLVAAAVGTLFGYRGDVLVVEGQGFANTVPAYDSFRNGSRTDASALPPFTLDLQQLDVQYQPDGQQRGAPRDFRAQVEVGRPGEPPRSAQLRVNAPLHVGGATVYLIGNGYAPEFTVRARDGTVLSRGPVPFLPRDASFTSTGVVKVPSATPQVGFAGLFLPTAFVAAGTGPVSVFPAPDLPRVVLTVFTGDLGVDTGAPQSLYALDTDRMTQVQRDGRPLAQVLAPGETLTLPDGSLSITFDGVRRFATLHVADDPGWRWALLAGGCALGSLLGSLLVRRRRVWVRARPAGPDDGRPRTVVEVAGLARSGREAVASEVAGLARRLQRDGYDRPTSTGGST